MSKDGVRADIRNDSYRSQNHDEEVANLTQMRSSALKLEMEGLAGSPLVVWTLSEEWTDKRLYQCSGVRSNKGANEFVGEKEWK